MCEGTRVSTYLALTFGTLLSSQRTDASITTLTARSGRFPLGVSNSTKALSESVCRTVELNLVGGCRRAKIARYPLSWSLKPTGAERLDATRGAPLGVEA